MKVVQKKHGGHLNSITTHTTETATGTVKQKKQNKRRGGLKAAKAEDARCSFLNFFFIASCNENNSNVVEPEPKHCSIPSLIRRLGSTIATASCLTRLNRMLHSIGMVLGFTPLLLCVLGLKPGHVYVQQHASRVSTASYRCHRKLHFWVRVRVRISTVNCLATLEGQGHQFKMATGEHSCH
jgi:hypothetical protein